MGGRQGWLKCTDHGGGCKGDALVTNEVVPVFGHTRRLTAKDNGPVEPGLVPRLSWSMHCAVHTVRATGSTLASVKSAFKKWVPVKR